MKIPLDLYSRKDLADSLWRIFAEMGESVEISILDGSEGPPHIVIFVPLKAELEADGIFEITKNDWDHYEER